MSSDESDLEFVETTPASDAPSGDVIPGRGRRPPVHWSIRPLWLALVVALAVLAGIGIGYLAGRGERHAAAPTPTSAPTASSSVAGLALGLTGNVCFGVPGDGRRLLLGVQIVNTASEPVVLRAIHVELPLSGLQVLSTHADQCVENATQQVAGYRLGPAAAAWISMTSDVLVRCPASLPVRFNVDYSLDGTSASQLVGGFSDLGSVPFPGCPTS